MARLADELPKRHKELNSHLQRLKEERKRIEGELANLVEVIAKGNGTPAIMTAINQREDRIRTISSMLVEPGPGSLERKTGGASHYGLAHLTEMRRLLAKTRKRARDARSSS